MSTATLRDEVTDLLQRLIRVDTTNPPGNETAAAELLRDYLEANGIECELIAKVPERANLVARIPGGDGPSLSSSGTRTSCSPTRPSGRCRRSPASSVTGRSGGAARST